MESKYEYPSKKGTNDYENEPIYQLAHYTYEEVDVDKADTPSKTKRNYSSLSQPFSHDTDPSATLAKPVFLLLDEKRRLQIAANEKVNIIFNFQNKHCIYRQKDGTIAVVEEASYQEDKPPILFDGNKYKGQLPDARVVLIYAVSEKDQESVDKRGVEIQERDVVLVLAQSSRFVVGITFDNEVGIFVASLLTPITEPRLCISDGMILNMCGSKHFIPGGDIKSVEKWNFYQVAKASVGLFKWLDIRDEHAVSLHCLFEVTLFQSSLPHHHRPIQGPSDKSLEAEPWFHPNLSRQQSEVLIRNDGDFLVRYKSNRPWEYVISCKYNGVSHHVEMKLKDGYSVRMVIYEHWTLRRPLEFGDQSIHLINAVCKHDASADTDDDLEVIPFPINRDEKTLDSGDSRSDEWGSLEENAERNKSSSAEESKGPLEGSGARPKQIKGKVLSNTEFLSSVKGNVLRDLTYMEFFADENGGDIVMPSAMVRVSIPPNALTSKEIIGITIFNDTLHGISEGPRVCPLISLDPDGLQFKLPVEVSIAHCGIVDDKETVEPTVYIGRVNIDNVFEWEELKSRCSVSDNVCHFTLEHFCLIDIKVGVKGKKIKVIPVAERMLLGEDLLMTCWMLNSNSSQDVVEEIRNDVNPSAVILDTFQEFVILQTNQPLHCRVRSHNKQWSPVAIEQLLPFRQIWYSSRASFKFRHTALSETAHKQTRVNFSLEFKQPDNHKIVFNVRTKLENLLRSQQNLKSAKVQDDGEDTLLFTIAKRMDQRDCMRVATYFNFPPEALDHIKGKKQIGVALFRELRKRNFYTDISLKDLTNALRGIDLSWYASQIETTFPKRVNAKHSNVEVPDDFGKLKVTISDQLNRDQCMQLLTLWNLTANFKTALEMDETPAILLLYELEKLGLFGKDNLGEVCQVFGELKFYHLSDIIKSYRQGRKGLVTKASFSLRRLLTQEMDNLEPIWV